MTPEMYALGLRARNAKRFRWMWGMAASAPGWLADARIIDVDTAPYLWEYRGTLRGRHDGDKWDDDVAPVLDDDATLGCLLALVREAWDIVPNEAGEPTPARLHTTPWEDGRWAVYIQFALAPNVRRTRVIANAATETEALVTALEAAP